MRTAAPRAEASADAQTELTWLVYETLQEPAGLDRSPGSAAAPDGGGGAWSSAGTTSPPAAARALHQVGLDPALVDRYETEFSGKNPWMQAEQLYQARAIVAGEEICRTSI